MNRTYLVSKIERVWDAALLNVKRVETLLPSHGWFSTFEDCWHFSQKLSEQDDSPALFSVAIVEQHNASETA